MRNTKNRNWKAWPQDRKTEKNTLSMAEMTKENIEKHLKKWEKLCMIAIVV